MFLMQAAFIGRILKCVLKKTASMQLETCVLEEDAGVLDGFFRHEKCRDALRVKRVRIGHVVSYFARSSPTEMLRSVPL